MSKILIYLLFLLSLFYILGLFFFFISQILLKTEKVGSLIFSNFLILLKKLVSIAAILFFVSMLIIWISAYLLPIKTPYVTIPLNYLSAILIAISMSSIEVIFFLLGFVTFKNKAQIKVESITKPNKDVNKFIIILLSIAMILSVFIDYFASLGFLVK